MNNAILHYPKVKYINTLSKTDLQNLFAGNILALRYPYFCTAEEAEATTNSIRSHPVLGRYGDARGFGRLGPGIYELLLGTEYWQEYLDTKDAVIDALKILITKLQSELAQAWGKCEAPIFRGHAMRPMMARILEPNGHSALPHDDFQKRYASDFPWAASLQGKVGANIHITPPEKGGELLMWDLSLSTCDYERMRLNGSYGINPALLPEHDVEIMPTKAELILINTRKLHAICPVKSGIRVTTSCFIGYTDDNSLLQWSYLASHK
jgi:hypothetical protein